MKQQIQLILLFLIILQIKADLKDNYYNQNQFIGQISLFQQQCPPGYNNLALTNNPTTGAQYLNSRQIVYCSMFDNSQANQINKNSNDILNIVQSFTVLIIIIYIFAFLILMFACKTYFKKQQVQAAVVELDPEYQNLAKKYTDLTQNQALSQENINKELQEQINNCIALLQNGNLKDKNQQLEIDQLNQKVKDLEDQMENTRKYQEEIIQQKQEQIEMREIELIEKQEIIQQKQDVIQDQIMEIQELQDQLQQKVLKEDKIEEPQQVEIPIEQMNEESLQSLLIKKRQQKKDRGNKFLGDLKQHLYDAINKQKIFHNKDKEVARVNAFTELYSQFSTSFNNLNTDNNPKVQKAMEKFHNKVQKINDKRIKKIEITKNKDGTINYKALVKKYILAIENRAKDYFDLLKRLTQRYDMSIVMQVREATEFLLAIQDVFLEFNDTLNILSNNDLCNNVNIWFKDLIALIDAYTIDNQQIDQEISNIENQLKKVRQTNAGI